MVSKKIKALRKHYNYKQDDLAIACDVTRSAISNWEANRRDPNPESLRKLASLFDVSMEQLLDDEITIKELLRKENNVVNSFYNDQVVNEHKKTHNFVHKFNMVLTLIVTICLLIVLIPAIRENDIFNKRVYDLTNIETVTLKLSNNRDVFEYEMFVFSDDSSKSIDKTFFANVNTVELYLQNSVYYNVDPLYITVVVNNVHVVKVVLLLDDEKNLVKYTKFNNLVIYEASELIFVFRIKGKTGYIGAFLDE